MVHSSSALVAAAASLLLVSPVHASLYVKNSPVLQLDNKNFDSLIKYTNHTSIVEFYAPWCGHCKNLKPAYEKAAKSLKGLAKVGAINCDEEVNKPVCGSHGIQGFPTLKIFRPSKKFGKPTVEDYNGPRNAKGIADKVVELIPNHVKRLSDKNVDEWLSENNSSAKALLFTEKGGTTSALLRAIAIDFLGSISVAQIRKSESKAVETFGVSTYPTLILLPGGDKEGIVYDGEMKKDGMVEFLSQITPPNPDPAPKQKKSSPKKDTKSAEEKKKKATKEPKSSSEPKAEEVTEPIEGEEPSSKDDETESPPPPVVKEAPTIPTQETADTLEQACFQPKSNTCLLALLPAQADNEAAQQALASLAAIHHKHEAHKSHLFPFYAVPAANELAGKLRKELGLKADEHVELVATNAKRSWWKHYKGEAFGQIVIEDWVDAIRMGDGKKEKLPDGIVKVEPEPEVKDEL